MPKTRILIDANSVAHAAHRGTILKAGDQETQAVYNTIKTVRSVRVRYPDASIIVLWDGRSWRKDKSTVYKANREDSAEKVEERRRLKTQMPFLRKGLGMLGVPQLLAFNLEADDLAAHLTQRYIAAGDNVRLISGDQDWLQLVGPRCVWEDHRDESKKVNAASFPEWTGVDTPLQFVQLKALQGDISDNLPGVGGIGEVKALQIIKVWGRVETFLADTDPASTWASKGLTKTKTNKATGQTTVHPEPFHKALKDFHADLDGRHAKFFHNMLMMDLISGHQPAPERMTLSKGALDPEGFMSLCQELAFHSIYREGAFEPFIAPFRKH